MKKSMTFAGILARLREEAGISQRELSRRSKVAQPYISRLELGEDDYPSWDVVCRLADALGVPVQAFRGEQ